MRLFTRSGIPRTVAGATALASLFAGVFATVPSAAAAAPAVPSKCGVLKAMGFQSCNTATGVARDPLLADPNGVKYTASIRASKLVVISGKYFFVAAVASDCKGACFAPHSDSAMLSIGIFRWTSYWSKVQNRRNIAGAGEYGSVYKNPQIRFTSSRVLVSQEMYGGNMGVFGGNESYFGYNGITFSALGSLDRSFTNEASGMCSPCQNWTSDRTFVARVGAYPDITLTYHGTKTGTAKFRVVLGKYKKI